jgi:hypothetical protein
MIAARAMPRPMPCAPPVMKIALSLKVMYSSISRENRNRVSRRSAEKICTKIFKGLIGRG